MHPKKILAIKLRSLGDTVLLTGALLKLRELFPKAEIHALITEPWCPIFERHPAVDRVIPFVKREERTSRARQVIRTAFQLRKEKYDLVLGFHASPSSATIAFASGAPVRSIHFHGHEHRNRYSTVEIPGKGIAKPIIERDLDVIRALGKKITEGSVKPQVFLSPDEISGARSRFFSAMAKSPTLILSFGASRATKIWPLKKFAELSHLWVKETGGRVLVIRAPGEEELLKEYLADLDPSFIERDEVKVLPLLPIRELASVLHLSHVFVGNDSGPKHLAVAAGTRTVTMIGPEDPFEWHPYSPVEHPYLYIPGLACRKDALPGMPPWCGIQVCIVEKHRCMESISAMDVFRVAKEGMR